MVATANQLLATGKAGGTTAVLHLAMVAAMATGATTDTANEYSGQPQYKQKQKQQ